MTIFTTSSLTLSRQRSRNRTIVGILLSILIHVALFLIVRDSLQDITPPPSADKPPLQVSLVQQRPAAVSQPEPVKPVPQPKPQAKPKSQAKPKPSPRAQHQVVRRSQAPSARAAVPSPSAMTRAAPEMDMSTMINAARERRSAAESSAAQENAQARAAEQGPSDNDVARANIAFQERRARGINRGVFEIVSKGPRVAEYIFRGFYDGSRNKAETHVVDAGLGGDVERAVVDDIIKVIRQHFKGDFNWDSYRLGHVVTLSAREEDTAGLRAFLLREIFN